MIGELPGDFLRVSYNQQQQMIGDERIAQILQAQQQAGFMHPVPTNIQGRLSLSVVQVSGPWSISMWFKCTRLHQKFSTLTLSLSPLFRTYTNVISHSAQELGTLVQLKWLFVVVIPQYCEFFY